MNLLLITETQIIQQIFSLVCKKQNIDLTISESTTVSENYDLIIIDNSFIDDKFNIIKQYTKRLGAITSEELPFDKSRDFLIPRPFLPTKLQEILKDEISIIKDEIQKEKEEQNVIIPTSTFSESLDDTYPEETEVTVPVTNYVDSLVEDVYLDIEDESDESIVSPASLDKGGVLDFSELNKINDILKEEEIQNEITIDKNDWKDISDIIDDALDEVKEYEFDIKDTIKLKDTFEPLDLVLSDYNIEELRPLLEKFDQGVIDKLSSGESIDVRLVLKENS